MLIYLGEHFLQEVYFVQCMDLPREGILYSVLTYLGGWAVWVGLCIKTTPDLPKIQGKTINSVPELTFS